MELPTQLGYPVIAVGDLHGRVEWLDKLVAKLRRIPEWPAARFAFLGDLGDRTPTVKALVERVLELIAEKPGSTCVCGNHDMALAGAAGLGGPPVPYWVKRYGRDYDHSFTFQSYLGRKPEYDGFDGWEKDLAELRDAMPAAHRELFANLPWVAEAEGHAFLHNGLSGELDCPAELQLECLRRRAWNKAVVNPKFGTDTDRLFTPHYPVWVGADRKLSADPLPIPGRVQVSGHIMIDKPDVNPARIRIDTSGGVREPLTACVLTGPTAEPRFVFSDR